MICAPSSVPFRVKSFLFAAFALFWVGSFKGIRCMQWNCRTREASAQTVRQALPCTFFERPAPAVPAAFRCHTMQKPPRTFCRPGRFLPFGRNALQQRVQHKPRRARARHHKDGVLLPAPQHEQRGGKQQHGNEVHIREPCGQRVRTEK